MYFKKVSVSVLLLVTGLIIISGMVSCKRKSALSQEEQMTSWAGAISNLKEAIAQETAETGRVDDIPVQYRVKAQNGGTIEKISYKT